MLRLPQFMLHRPRTLREALSALSGDGAMLVAGGTDLVPKLKRRQFEPATLVSLADVDEMTGVADGKDRVEMGALTRLRDLEALDFGGQLTAFVQAVESVATPILRNNATIGGNLLQDTRCRYYDRGFFWREAVGNCLKKDADVCRVASGGNKCFATLCSDIAPALVVLDARVTLAGVDGSERTIPLEDLYRDDGMSHLQLDNEILTRVSVPKDGRRSVYKKLRPRGSFDFPELGVAVSMSDVDGRCQIAVAVSAVAPNVFVMRDTLERSDLPAFVKRVHGALKPMDTMWFAPAYRKRVARHFLEQAIDELVSAG